MEERSKFSRAPVGFGGCVSGGLSLWLGLGRRGFLGGDVYVRGEVGRCRFGSCVGD